MYYDEEIEQHRSSDPQGKSLSKYQRIRADKQIYAGRISID